MRRIALFALLTTACGEYAAPQRPSAVPLAVETPGASGERLVQVKTALAHPSAPPTAVVAQLQPPAGQPPVGQPPAGQPPVAQPPAGQPPAAQPPAPPVLTVVTPPASEAKQAVEVVTRQSGSHVLLQGGGDLTVVVDLKALPAAHVDVEHRLPLNVALVIDRSGSMRGDKMDRTREAARKFVEGLDERDTFALVSYSDDVRVDLSAGRATADHKGAALRAIARMQPSGSTNLSGGLFRGQSEVSRNLATGVVNRVLLMSDGLANRGVTDVASIAQAAQREAQRGLSVTTIGVGTDYNEDLMTAVADQGSGNYYFVENAQSVPGVLGAELSKMASTVAQDARVELTLDDGTDFQRVIGYSYTRSGEKVVVPLAEMFGGQRRSITLHVSIPTVREGLFRVGEVAVSYSDPQQDGARVTRSVPVNVTVTRDAAQVDNGRDPSVDDRLVEIRAASVINMAAERASRGDNAGALELLDQNARDIQVQATSTGSARMEAQVKNLERARGLLEGAASAGAPAAAPAAAVKQLKADSFELAR